MSSRNSWSSVSIGSRVRFIILFVLSLSALSAGAHLLSIQRPLVSFGSLHSGEPPVVPHDGVKVLQPLDDELAKCPTEMPSKAAEMLVEHSASFGDPSVKPTSKNPASFLKSRHSLSADHKKKKSSPEASQDSKAERHRTHFACAAGCSAQEPQLEHSLAPWADWKTNSSGLDMIDSLEGFCAKQLTSKDPFVITVLWRGDVYFKACRAESVNNVGLYLIGPEDLSLVMVLLFGAQRIGQLPSGPIAFGMYLSDYTSLLDRHLVGPGLPIFSYLGRDTSWAIPWPSSFTLLATQEVEKWQHEQAKKSQDQKQKAWQDRESKAFWIGAVTGPWEFALDNGLMAIPRMKLLKMATDNPQQLQAEWSGSAGYGIRWIKYNGNVSGFLAPRSRSIEELTGIPKAGFKGTDEWENYKYYVNLDGVVLGGRISKLFALGGVVLQHQAGYLEHTDALMKPYEHYVPIEYDLSDLVEKVKWLQNNEAEAQRIADNGKALAMKRMRFEDSTCYIWRALEGLGTKTASAPVDEQEVEERLKDYQHAWVHDGGMRPTMEAFWGEKLEEIKTGDRKMTSRGIDLLTWAWGRMEGLYKKVQAQDSS